MAGISARMVLHIERPADAGQWRRSAWTCGRRGRPCKRTRREGSVQHGGRQRLEGCRYGDRRGGAGIPLARPAGQARNHPDQADGDAARSLARLFAGRGCAGEAHRRRSELGLRLHDARQPRRRHLQRHRHPRPRQSRRARLEAGDGRQGGALQALRRRRRDRPRSRDRGRRRVRQRGANSSARPSAASTSRTSARPTASSSKAGCAS